MTGKYCYLIFAFQFLAVSCQGQSHGCMDPMAMNYNPDATINDGSCLYATFSMDPVKSLPLSDSIAETSGMIFWDGFLWTHNDSQDNRLYRLDSVNGQINLKVSLEGAANKDWEEIQQDAEFIYIGDFGNNQAGNRTDLHLLRIEKNSILSGGPKIDTIWFTYSDQTDFSPSEPNQTDFDCEAFVVGSDSIYLFTKQWITMWTAVYSLPKSPGVHTATKRTEFNAEGLVTGAYFDPSRSLLVLCGYTGFLSPFLHIFYDYSADNFFSGNKRKVDLSLSFHQIEGIASEDGLTYFVSNESYEIQPIGTFPQKLHRFDLTGLLGGYLAGLNGVNPGEKVPVSASVFPNPFGSEFFVNISPDAIGAYYNVFDEVGRIIDKGTLLRELNLISLKQRGSGVYLLHVGRPLNERFLLIRE